MATHLMDPTVVGEEILYTDNDINEWPGRTLAHKKIWTFALSIGHKDVADNMDRLSIPTLASGMIALEYHALLFTSIS